MRITKKNIGKYFTLKYENIIDIINDETEPEFKQIQILFKDLITTKQFEIIKKFDNEISIVSTECKNLMLIIYLK